MSLSSLCKKVRDIEPLTLIYEENEVCCTIMPTIYIIHFLPVPSA